MEDPRLCYETIYEWASLNCELRNISTSKLHSKAPYPKLKSNFIQTPSFMREHLQRLSGLPVFSSGWNMYSHYVSSSCVRSPKNRCCLVFHVFDAVHSVLRIVPCPTLRHMSHIFWASGGIILTIHYRFRLNHLFPDLHDSPFMPQCAMSDENDGMHHEPSKPSCIM